MKLCIINPNTTESMTQTIRRTAKNFCNDTTKLIVTNPTFGPESIEGYYDEVFCIPGLISEIKKHPAADVYIIACFDDTGLDAARTFTAKPVIGIGEASYHVASLLAGNFSVITTLDVSILPLKHNILKLGLDRLCVNVSSIQIPVLEIEKIDTSSVIRLEQEIERTIEEDRAEAIVLGCAGMSSFTTCLEQKFKLPVIDGVSSAVVLAEGLGKLAKSTSKIGSYGFPRQKKYAGSFSSFQP